VARRQAIIRVSRQLLIELLRLPAGTEIVGISDQVYFDTGDVAIKVEHPCFAPVETDGGTIPTKTPSYEVEDGVVKFIGWSDGGFCSR